MSKRPQKPDDKTQIEEHPDGTSLTLPSKEVYAKIGMTGASGFRGHLVLKRLVELPHVKEIHVFDIKAPLVHAAKVIFHRVDLTRDGADELVANLLLKNEIKCVVHGALFSGPGRGGSQRREVETIGTFHILNALAEAKIERCVVLGDTFVYGAHSQNPNFITESKPLKPLGPDFVKARVDVEGQLKEFAEDYPQCTICVLRFAPILGPNSTNVRARYFLAGIIPKVLGYDPLLQFIHEDDAAQAAMLAVFSKAKGAFNIVGKGVLPLSTGIHLSGRVPVPVATPICKTVFSLGFMLRLWDLPSAMVPFFQYICVADGAKANKVLGFLPKYSSRQALKALIEAARLRSVGFSIPSSALGEEQPLKQDEGFVRVF
ncbi:NAD-dependent epimerase/dehydratase family protein [bacterium]|nr:NAD-dependent epimerase/dehydratase family protein [bacterium]